MSASTAFAAAATRECRIDRPRVPRLVLDVVTQPTGIVLAVAARTGADVDGADLNEPMLRAVLADIHRPGNPGRVLLTADRAGQLPMTGGRVGTFLGPGISAHRRAHRLEAHIAAWRAAGMTGIGAGLMRLGGGLIMRGPREAGLSPASSRAAFPLPTGHA
jgi:hypothetical protein